MAGITRCLLLFASILLPGIALGQDDAQDASNGASGMVPFHLFTEWNDQLQELIDEDLQHELAMSPEQINSISQLHRALMDFSKTALDADSPAWIGPVDSPHAIKSISEIVSAQKSSVHVVLSPIQIEAWENVLRLRRTGFADEWPKPDKAAIADVLKLDKGQQEKLDNTIAKIREIVESQQKVAEKAIAEELETRRQESLGLLSSEQREKYDRLVGDCLPSITGGGRQSSSIHPIPMKKKMPK